MRAYLWVSVGALAGANLRYFLSRLAAKLISTNFPYGTLLINVTGSLLVGYFLAWTTERALVDPKWR
ncbi:MAG TPA: CrcB family protein, partial [Terriglobales bacterium]|nr:CrcB family protein [Terriglobales bacterium]